MDSSFKLSLPEINRSLKIEPASRENTFKIYHDGDWSLSDLDHEELELELEEIPDNPLLGILHIRSLKDFTFEGKGVLSGDDIRFLVNYLINHPSFVKKEQ